MADVLHRQPGPGDRSRAAPPAPVAQLPLCVSGAIQRHRRLPNSSTGDHLTEENRIATDVVSPRSSFCLPSTPSEPLISTAALSPVQNGRNASGTVSTVCRRELAVAQG